MSPASTPAPTTTWPSRSSSTSCSPVCARCCGDERVGRRRVLRVGDLVARPGARQVWRGDRELDLTKTEFDLLELLVLNAGIVLTRDDLRAHLGLRLRDAIEDARRVHLLPAAQDRGGRRGPADPHGAGRGVHGPAGMSAPRPTQPRVCTRLPSSCGRSWRWPSPATRTPRTSTSRRCRARPTVLPIPPRDSYAPPRSVQTSWRARTRTTRVSLEFDAIVQCIDRTAPSPARCPTSAPPIAADRQIAEWAAVRATATYHRRPSYR